MNLTSSLDPRTQIDYEAGADPELKGRECQGCRRLFTFESRMFERDSSDFLGYKKVCVECAASPKMTMKDHLARLKEENFYSEGTQKQRHQDQDEMHKDRNGKPMDCSLFLGKLKTLCPSLYVTQGGVKGDLALYVTSPTVLSEWGGKNFKYLGYITVGILPEYSKYEFDEKDIVLRPTQIGWRNILVRFILEDILSEKQCDKKFGIPSGGRNSIWYRKIWRKRNNKG